MPTLRRLADAVPTVLLVFVAMAFVLPSEPAYALVFYVLVIPPVAAWCVLQPGGIARLGPAALGLALVVWSGLTLIWGHDDGHRTASFALGAACSFLFLAGSTIAFASPLQRRRLGDVLVVLGVANASLSLVLGFVLPSNGPRLHGWGATEHPILGASVMAVAYLTALSRAVRALEPAPGEAVAPRRHTIWAYLGACGAMAAFILMTESRGPLLAAFIATVFVCVAGPWRLRALGGLAAVAIIWELLPADLRHHQAAVLVERGSSRRFEIWGRTLSLIRGRPVFGHGLAANVDVPGITFPHDLYLSVLFYSGLIGFALFCALVVTVTWRLWRGRMQPEWPWLAALWINALVSGLTDLGQITKGPGPMWLIVWLPVALAAASVPARITGGGIFDWPGARGWLAQRRNTPGYAGMGADISES